METKTAQDELAELRAEVERLTQTLDGLRALRVEDYAKLDEAYDRTHAAEDKVARVEALAAVLSKVSTTGESYPGSTLGDSAVLIGAVAKDLRRALDGSA